MEHIPVPDKYKPDLFYGMEFTILEWIKIRNAVDPVKFKEWQKGRFIRITWE